MEVIQMAYSLIFTIYSLIFSIFLFITILFKKKFNTSRAKFYLLLNIFAMIFAVLEIISILIYGFTSNFEVYSWVWKIRNVVVIYYAFFYLAYYLMLVRGEKYSTLKDTIIKSPVLLILFIVLTLIAIFYLIFMSVSHMFLEEIQFVRGAIGVILITVCGFAALIALFSAFMLRKKSRNLFISFLLIFILFVVGVSLQMVFQHVSLMPFVSMFLLYIIYYNIENPDIEMYENVILLKDSIDKSSNSKTDFLFNLSSDLVNPMNTIVSLSESICNMEVYDDNQVVEDLNNIKYAGNLLLDSINNILDRNEADSADSINLREYSVIELINRLKSVTLSRIGAKQVSFDVEIDPNVSSKLNGDISKIQKVLLNILSNSVKFTDVGKIKFNISATMGKDNTQIIHFKVSDTGCGINDSQKSFVFSGSQSDKSGGGLSVSKKYIEAMNGEIRFESNFGAGTTFYVDIPQGIVGSRLISEDMVDTGSSNINEAADFSNCKILVVDDDNLDIKVTTRLLQRYKVQVMSITSSLECIDRIKREEEFDLIFLDHKMPDFDGVDTLKSLKQLDGYNIPKIVCLTANAVNGAREYYMSNGFDDYLAKPIDINELDRIMKKFCKKKNN